MVQRRVPFTAPYRHLKRQRGWLVELERRLDPPAIEGSPRPSGHQVQLQVRAFFAELRQHAEHHPQDAAVVTHISATFAHRWPRLFACYAWPERYPTNNELETFFGRLRTRQRQTNGHKSTHDFILRYGEWAVFVDPQESFEQVLNRIQQFKQKSLIASTLDFRKRSNCFRCCIVFATSLAVVSQHWSKNGPTRCTAHPINPRGVSFAVAVLETNEVIICYVGFIEAEDFPYV